MFQSYDDISDPSKGAGHTALLRAKLKACGLAGFLIPRGDEHMNEYVSPCAERLFWLTGFSGSAGMAAVLDDTAALFVDGRYTLQAPDQVDTALFEILQIPGSKPSAWLKLHLNKGDQLGYDPRLHSVSFVERMQKELAESKITLVPVETNLVDAVWKDRPLPPLAPVSLHPIEYAGESSEKKIVRIQKAMRKANTGASILTLPDSIAWLLNIRGRDVPHTPLPLSYAIVHADKRPELFIAPEKLTGAVRDALMQACGIHEPEKLEKRLAALGADNAKVQLDPDTASFWFADVLCKAGAEIVRRPDPCQLPKAIKNETEIQGAHAAHKRDGTAMCRFLAWLDQEASSGSLDEIAASRKLEAFRAGTGKLKEISFDTISGAGANGAIVHYRVTRKTNACLKPGSLYLVDSGAQYEDGTTDITRTVSIGEPAPDMRTHFTLVLKGHIAIATARFPKGTRGADLDPFARRALWEAGLDFDHGTGHGVGSYLSVHEGPASISRRGTKAALEPGMILSNEPGLYREGQYGIRIETLVLVTQAENIKGGDRPMMGFETLTLAPMDTRLIDVTALSEHEREWLNAYHARVRNEIGPELTGEDRTWLEQATMPLKGGLKEPIKGPVECP